MKIACGCGFVMDRRLKVSPVGVYRCSECKRKIRNERTTRIRKGITMGQNKKYVVS